MSNAAVNKQIKPRHSLETLAVICKLKYFRHTMLTSYSLEKDLMLEFTDGSRRRGRQRPTWTDEMRKTITMNWHDNKCLAKQNAMEELIYKAVENRKRQNESD
jgi:hypothetical protein